MFQSGTMAASVVRLFVSVGSLRSVKSGGHWSESPSHWLFLYVKPFNVALQRYHETYFTCRLFPPGGISSCLRGLPRCTHVPSFGIDAKLGNNPPLKSAKTDRFLAGPMNTKHAAGFCVACAFLTPVGAVNYLCGSEGGVSNRTKPLEFVEIHSFARRHFSSVDACQHESSNRRTVPLPAASHRSHRPGMTWQNMRGNVAQCVSPAAIPVHKTWYTFARISPVWLSLLIIGWTWRSGAQRGSPRCEMIRLGQP